MTFQVFTNARVIREILTPMKRQGIPFEEAWESCKVRVEFQGGRKREGYNEFLYRIMKAAYNNDDETVNWNAVKQMTNLFE